MNLLRWAVLFVAAMLIQWWWNAHLSFGGAAPQFLFALTVVIAARYGPVAAMLAGYGWGLFSDTLRADLFGADALLYVWAGYSAGIFRREVDLSAPEPLAVTVFLMSWIYAILLGLLGRIFFKSFLWIGWVSFLTVPFMNAIVAIAGTMIFSERRDA